MRGNAGRVGGRASTRHPFAWLAAHAGGHEWAASVQRGLVCALLPRPSPAAAAIASQQFPAAATGDTPAALQQHTNRRLRCLEAWQTTETSFLEAALTSEPAGAARLRGTMLLWCDRTQETIGGASQLQTPRRRWRQSPLPSVVSADCRQLRRPLEPPARPCFCAAMWRILGMRRC